MSAAACVFVLIGIIFAVITKNESTLSLAVAESSENAVQLCLVLAGSMALWSGIMKVAEACGIVRALNRAVTPLLSRLMPELDQSGDGMSAASMNVAANLLGIGNAATPLGIKAMRAIDSELSGKRSSRALAAFTLLNTASVQLIPANVIAMRARAGSASPADCIVPVIINSAAALACGIVMLCLVYGGRKCRSFHWRRRC